MKFSFITLFPGLITCYTETSIIGRAVQNRLIEVETVNPRDFTKNPHRKVDDSPYGGGSGMVIACQPVYDAFLSLQPLTARTAILMTSPMGRTFDHAFAQTLAQMEQVVLLCGHYEGFDHRIHDLIPDMTLVSVGDFVLTGGELPSLCILDAVTRLIPGSVQKYASVESDSFYNGLLDYPHYTRPPEYGGITVPPVLLSGNHAEIEKWRHQEALRLTLQYRPDLLQKRSLSPREQQWINRLENSDGPENQKC